jgi:phosphoglycerol transferase MdoB-like AlkP superfamily enzyme
MRKIFETIRKIVLLDIIFLIFMACFRLAFLLYYGQAVLTPDLLGDIAKAFYMGARFDLAVIAYINLPVTLIFIVMIFAAKPKSLDGFLRKIKYYFGFMMGAVFIFLSIDFAYYSYFQNHLNILALGFFEDDTLALISTFNQNYNLFLIGVCLLIEFLIPFFISAKVLRPKEGFNIFTKPAGTVSKIIISILILAVNIIVARGSLGTFPLEMDMTGMAEVSKNSFINKVATNGFYTLQAALASRIKQNKGQQDIIKDAGYENNIRQAFADYLGVDIAEIDQEDPASSLKIIIPPNKTIDEIKPNVIVIVMESLGTSLIKYNSPTFNILGELKKHFDEDYVFYNFLPSSDGTMVSLEGVVTNFARRPGGLVLSQTEYAYKKYDFGAAVPYKKNGYATYFVYGGGATWRNLDTFLMNLGFDEVIGQGGMDKSYQKNEWGVYDEYLFDQVFKVLDSGSGQKFIGVLSTTNHPPFSLPKDYEPLSLEPPEALKNRTIDKQMAQARYAAYQYSSRALAAFIDRVKKSKYADNTIIVVTGDHSFWSLFENDSSSLLDKIAVPLYLYIPPKLRPAHVNKNVWGSHLDIMPTVYRLSLSSTTAYAMGNDIFASSDNIAYNDMGLLATVAGAVEYNLLNKKVAYYVYGKDTGLLPSLVDSPVLAVHERLIKHYRAMMAVADYLIKHEGK